MPTIALIHIIWTPHARTVCSAQRLRLRRREQDLGVATRHARRRGITLLEVMAASIIMGLLVVAVLRAYSTATAVSGRAEIQAQVASAMKESGDKWRNMVAVLQPGQKGPNQATGFPGDAWFDKNGQPNGPLWLLPDSLPLGTSASLTNRTVTTKKCNCDKTTINCNDPLPPGVPPDCMAVEVKVSTSD